MRAEHGSTASRRAFLGAAGAVVLASTAAAGSVAGDHPDAELLGLLARFDALERRFKATFAATGPGAIKDEAARDRHNQPLQAEQEALLAQIVATPTRTAQGFAARARSLLLWDDELSEDLQGDGGDLLWNERMLGAILRDLSAASA